MKPSCEKISSRLSRPVKEWIYAFTDIYYAGARTLLDIFYTFFLNQALGLPLPLAGTIYATALISRAVAEPIAGMWSDQWETRWGKRKPFFVVGAPFVFLSFILLWYPFDVSLGMKYGIAWSGAILYGVISGAMMAPYAAMGPDLVEDYHGRTHLSTVRQLFQLVAIAVTILIFSHYLTQGQTHVLSYRVWVVCFALLFSLPFVALTLFIPEKKHAFERGPWSTALHKIIWPFKVPAFRWYAALNVSMETILVLMPALFPFYLKFYTGTLHLLPAYAVALSGGAGGTIFVMLTYAKHVCKITWYRWGAIALGVVCAGMAWVTPDKHLFLFPLFVMLGMAVASTSSARLSMLSDLADYTSKLYRAHMQALVYALAKSLSQWGAGACVFLVFQISALKAGGEQSVISGEMAKWLLLTPVALLTVFAWISSFAYRLDQQTMEQQP